MGNAAFQEKSFAEAATHYRSVSEWQEISERGGERDRGEGEGEERLGLRRHSRGPSLCDDALHQAHANPLAHCD